MSKIIWVEAPMDQQKPGKPQFRTVVKDGRRVRIRVIDANSPDFTAQLTSAFRGNVRKARKENQALAGEP